VSRTILLSTSLLLALVVACAAALVIALVKPAEAAFPGRNGKIAFHSSRGGDVEASIYVMRPNGTHVRLLSHQGFDGPPQWSPSGKKIAFTSQDTDLEPRSEIYVMKADGSAATNITNSPNVHEVYAAWYPSGRRLAFCAVRTEYNEDHDLVAAEDYEVYSVRLDRSGRPTGPPIQLTDNDDRDCPSSAVSADGTKLAFTSDRDGDEEIYVMEANRSESATNPAVQLTHNDTRDYDVDWSPDGTKLAFVRRSQTSFSGDVYTMNANGADVKNLTESDENYDYGPSWSPNGKWIAFSSLRPTGAGNFGPGILKMRADGTREKRLTSEEDGNPDWQPLP
jgi:Tol biopolymer transport system component